MHLILCYIQAQADQHLHIETHFHKDIWMCPAGVSISTHFKYCSFSMTPTLIHLCTDARTETNHLSRDLFLTFKITPGNTHLYCKPHCDTKFTILWCVCAYSTALWCMNVQLTKQEKHTHHVQAPSNTPLTTINTTEKKNKWQGECFTRRGFSSDKGDFSSSEKLFPVIFWVELACKGLKLVSSVSKCLERPLSSCDRWEEVPGDGRLIVTWDC